MTPPPVTIPPFHRINNMMMMFNPSSDNCSIFSSRSEDVSLVPWQRRRSIRPIMRTDGHHNQNRKRLQRLHARPRLRHPEQGESTPLKFPIRSFDPRKTKKATLSVLIRTFSFPISNVDVRQRSGRCLHIRGRRVPPPPTSTLVCRPDTPICTGETL
jgi:hypothetical protein